MALIVCISLFLALMIAISLYGYRRYLRPARVYERLTSDVEYLEDGVDAPEEAKRERLLEYTAGRLFDKPFMVVRQQDDADHRRFRARRHGKDSVR